MDMRDYVRREPPRGGQLSANGVKTWGPRLAADAQRAKVNRAAVVCRILAREPGLAQDLGAMLREAHEAGRCPACPARSAS